MLPDSKIKLGAIILLVLFYFSATHGFLDRSSSNENEQRRIDVDRRRTHHLEPLKEIRSRQSKESFKAHDNRDNLDKNNNVVRRQRATLDRTIRSVDINSARENYIRRTVDVRARISLDRSDKFPKEHISEPENNNRRKQFLPRISIERSARSTQPISNRIAMKSARENDNLRRTVDRRGTALVDRTGRLGKQRTSERDVTNSVQNNDSRSRSLTRRRTSEQNVINSVRDSEDRRRIVDQRRDTTSFLDRSDKLGKQHISERTNLIREDGNHGRTNDQRRARTSLGHSDRLANRRTSERDIADAIRENGHGRRVVDQSPTQTSTIGRYARAPSDRSVAKQVISKRSVANAAREIDNRRRMVDQQFFARTSADRSTTTAVRRNSETNILNSVLGNDDRRVTDLRRSRTSSDRSASVAEQRTSERIVPNAVRENANRRGIVDQQSFARNSADRAANSVTRRSSELNTMTSALDNDDRRAADHRHTRISSDRSDRVAKQRTFERIVPDAIRQNDNRRRIVDQQSFSRTSADRSTNSVARRSAELNTMNSALENADRKAVDRRHSRASSDQSDRFAKQHTSERFIPNARRQNDNRRRIVNQQSSAKTSADRAANSVARRSSELNTMNSALDNDDRRAADQRHIRTSSDRSDRFAKQHRSERFIPNAIRQDDNSRRIVDEQSFARNSADRAANSVARRTSELNTMTSALDNDDRRVADHRHARTSSDRSDRFAKQRTFERIVPNTIRQNDNRRRVVDQQSFSRTSADRSTNSVARRSAELNTMNSALDNDDRRAADQRHTRTSSGRSDRFAKQHTSERFTPNARRQNDNRRRIVDQQSSARTSADQSTNSVARRSSELNTMTSALDNDDRRVADHRHARTSSDRSDRFAKQRTFERIVPNAIRQNDNRRRIVDQQSSARTSADRSTNSVARRSSELNTMTSALDNDDRRAADHRHARTSSDRSDRFAKQHTSERFIPNARRQNDNRRRIVDQQSSARTSADQSTNSVARRSSELNTMTSALDNDDRRAADHRHTRISSDRSDRFAKQRTFERIVPNAIRQNNNRRRIVDQQSSARTSADRSTNSVARRSSELNTMTSALDNDDRRAADHRHARTSSDRSDRFARQRTSERIIRNTIRESDKRRRIVDQTKTSADRSAHSVVRRRSEVSIMRSVLGNNGLAIDQRSARTFLNRSDRFSKQRVSEQILANAENDNRRRNTDQQLRSTELFAVDRRTSKANIINFARDTNNRRRTVDQRRAETFVEQPTFEQNSAHLVREIGNRRRVVLSRASTSLDQTTRLLDRRSKINTRDSVQQNDNRRIVDQRRISTSSKRYERDLASETNIRRAMQPSQRTIEQQSSGNLPQQVRSAGTNLNFLKRTVVERKNEDSSSRQQQVDSRVVPRSNERLEIYENIATLINRKSIESSSMTYKNRGTELKRRFSNNIHQENRFRSRFGNQVAASAKRDAINIDNTIRNFRSDMVQKPDDGQRKTNQGISSTARAVSRRQESRIRNDINQRRLSIERRSGEFKRVNEIENENSPIFLYKYSLYNKPNYVDSVAWLSIAKILLLSISVAQVISAANPKLFRINKLANIFTARKEKVC